MEGRADVLNVPDHAIVVVGRNAKPRPCQAARSRTAGYPRAVMADTLAGGNNADRSRCSASKVSP